MLPMPQMFPMPVMMLMILLSFLFLFSVVRVSWHKMSMFEKFSMDIKQQNVIASFNQVW